MHDLGPGSPLWVRLPSALVGATTTALAALGRAGGRRGAAGAADRGGVYGGLGFRSRDQGPT